MEDLLTVAAKRVEQRAEQNRRISDVIQRERRRLLHFIRQRIDDQGDAEDILQNVFYELIEAYRLMKPVEQAGAWLYRVARNRIIDRVRKTRPQAFGEVSVDAGEAEALRLEDLLPSPDASPEAAYARSVPSRNSTPRWRNFRKSSATCSSRTKWTAAVSSTLPMRQG